MSQLERCYGVVHGAYDMEMNFFGSLRTREKVVYPSEELEYYLKAQPPGTVIGLETCPEMSISREEQLGETFLVDGQYMKFADESPFYWRRLIEVCNKAGLKIELLDDFSLIKEYYRKLLEANKYKRALEREWMYDDIPRWVQLTKEGVRNAHEQIFRAEAESEYIHVVKREEKILENIHKKGVQIAIIGRGHGDYIVQKGTAFSPDKYTREVPSGWQSRLWRGKSGWMAEIDEEPLTQEAVLDRELLVRRYNAATYGRILPDSQPDFVGTWNLSCRSEGLFEVYLDRETIEDCLGTADLVSIESGGGRISFYKKYQRKRSAGSAKSDISYTATKASLIDEVYKGEWSTQGNRGEFYMCRGDKLNLFVSW